MHDPWQDRLSRPQGFLFFVLVILVTTAILMVDAVFINPTRHMPSIRFDELPVCTEEHQPKSEDGLPNLLACRPSETPEPEDG
jgi:hypothetical protein